MANWPQKRSWEENMTSSITRRSLLASAGAGLTAAALGGTRAVAQERELIFNIFLPARASIVANGLIPWAAEVEAASNGAISMTIPTATLAPPPRQMDIVQDGVADITVTANFWRPDDIYMPLITEIPFLSPTAEAASRALWASHEEIFAAQNEFEDFVVLSQFALTGSHLQSRSTPVQSLEDVAALKFHANPGLPAEMMQAMGAAVVPGPNLRAFELVSTGVADATLLGYAPGLNLGLTDQIAHITEFQGGFGRTSFSVIMNRDSFESLSQESQAALTSTSGGALAARIGSLADGDVARGRAAYLENGCKIDPPSDEFLAEATEAVSFVERNWIETVNAKGIDGEAALAFFREQVANA